MIKFMQNVNFLLEERKEEEGYFSGGIEKAKEVFFRYWEPGHFARDHDTGNVRGIRDQVRMVTCEEEELEENGPQTVMCLFQGRRRHG